MRTNYPRDRQPRCRRGAVESRLLSASFSLVETVRTGVAARARWRLRASFASFAGETSDVAVSVVVSHAFALEKQLEAVSWEQVPRGRDRPSCGGDSSARRHWHASCASSWKALTTTASAAPGGARCAASVYSARSFRRRPACARRKPGRHVVRRPLSLPLRVDRGSTRSGSPPTTRNWRRRQRTEVARRAPSELVVRLGAIRRANARRRCARRCPVGEPWRWRPSVALSQRPTVWSDEPPSWHSEHSRARAHW